MKNNYHFFTNKDCKYYPCHNICMKTGNINCLFCFCPLYHDDNCGGNYTYTNKNIKDCSSCTLPHTENAYSYIINKIRRI